MYVGAFDIGGTKTIVALADGKGTILDKKQFPTHTESWQKHFDACCDEFISILTARHLSADEISAIGVNLPGIVERSTGTLLRAVYAGWFQVPVKRYLSLRLGIERIVCENDVNSCAEGEIMFGLGNTYKNFGWMTVSTGVGGAVVCEGKLIRGAHGYAGEMGHLKVEYDDPSKCPCGEFGCLEAHGSGTALGNMLKKALETNKNFLNDFENSGQTPSGVSCARLAENGNQEAIAIFDRLGEYLGRGISYYVNILDPEAVVIGGGVAESLNLLMPGIQKALGKYTFAEMQDVRVVKTALGYEAALMGAVAIAIKECKEG